MARALGLFGLGGGFLAISPRLRDTLVSSISLGVSTLDKYSPYSYIAVALGTMGILMISLYRSSTPR